MIQFFAIIATIIIVCLMCWNATKINMQMQEQEKEETIRKEQEKKKTIRKEQEKKEKQRQYEEVKHTAMCKYKQNMEVAYQHACLVHEYRMKYIQQIHDIIKQYMQVLVTKYNQLTYTDDYGLVVESAFFKEFSNNFVPRVLAPLVYDPMADGVLRKSYETISNTIKEFYHEYYVPVLKAAKLSGCFKHRSDFYLCGRDTMAEIMTRNGMENKLYVDEGIYNAFESGWSIYKYDFFDFNINISSTNNKPDTAPQISIYGERLGAYSIALKLFLYEKQFVQNTSGVGRKHEITPLDYEKYIAAQLKEIGFNARTTKGSGDQGADVIAKKDGKSFAIQCKMYSSPVGNKAVQEANAGRDFYKCDYGVVVSNASFTKSARQAANACNIILLNDTQLDKLLKYTE